MLEFDARAVHAECNEASAGVSRMNGVQSRCLHRSLAALLMTRPSSALRAPSPRERGEGELLLLSPLAPRERGEGGRRPGEGRVINASAVCGAVIPLGMKSKC